VTSLGEQIMKMRRILVPVDFSSGSHAAVRYARGLAAEFGSNLYVLHAVKPPDDAWYRTDEFASDSGPAPASARIHALHHLSALIVAEHLDPFHTTGVVRFGRPDDEITRYADDIQADLIIMGLHGDHFAPSRGMGKIVQRVLDRAQCPVLAVPEQRAEVRHLAQPRELQPLAS
jgi:nucleotide-binding universal stress UspA family protein